MILKKNGTQNMKKYLTGNKPKIKFRLLDFCELPLKRGGEGDNWMLLKCLLCVQPLEAIISFISYYSLAREVSLLAFWRGETEV